MPITVAVPPGASAIEALLGGYLKPGTGLDEQSTPPSVIFWIASTDRPRTHRWYAWRRPLAVASLCSNISTAIIIAAPATAPLDRGKSIRPRRRPPPSSPARPWPVLSAAPTPVVTPHPMSAATMSGMSSANLHSAFSCSNIFGVGRSR